MPALGRANPDPPAVLLDDRVGDGQAQAGSLAHFLRREERVEDLRPRLLRYPRPIVVHLEDDRVVLAVVPGADDEHAVAVRGQHGLLGVDDEVQQHLLQLVRVGEHLRQARRERGQDGDVRDALLVGAQRQRLLDDGVDVHHRARGVALAREREQVADDARRAVGLGEDHVEAAARLIVGLPLRQALGPGEDGGQRVVQLVRDARDRLAERRQLLGLQQLVVAGRGSGRRASCDPKRRGRAPRGGRRRRRRSRRGPSPPPRSASGPRGARAPGSR